MANTAETRSDLGGLAALIGSAFADPSLLERAETQLAQFEYHEKIPLKRDYARLGVRVVPPAVARYGSFLEPGVILMPSYVNIGARVGSGTMVDTWATVGSGAQIGRDVHLAGGG